MSVLSNEEKYGRSLVTREKRKGDKPIPDDIQSYLNEEQLSALEKIEGFGWTLRFIRRPLFQTPTAVVINSSGNSIGVLEEDGRLNIETDIVIRE